MLQVILLIAAAGFHFWLSTSAFESIVVAILLFIVDEMDTIGDRVKCNYSNIFKVHKMVSKIKYKVIKDESDSSGR